MKAFIQQLQEGVKLPGHAHFIIQDLGAAGLFVTREAVPAIQVRQLSFLSLFCFYINFLNFI